MILDAINHEGGREREREIEIERERERDAHYTYISELTY